MPKNKQSKNAARIKADHRNSVRRAARAAKRGISDVVQTPTAPAPEAAPSMPETVSNTVNACMDNTPPRAFGFGPEWCPSWGIAGTSPIAVVNQAERELLLLVEYCAPKESKQRLASLVSALVGFSNDNVTLRRGSDRQY